MKIAFLNIYSGQVFRGAERSISELAKRLTKNHEVTVIQGRVEKKNYHVHPINIRINIKGDTSTALLRKLFLDYYSLKILIFTLKALPYLWKNNLDIIIATNGGWQALICRILTWIKGSKLVITSRAGKGWDDWFNILCRPDAFVAVSPALLSWARERAFGVRVVQIPNGVDLNKFTPHVKALKVKLPRPIILAVGALTPWKRLHLVIEAVSQMDNASLLIVGEGNKEMTKMIKTEGYRKLGDRFMLLSVSFEEMPSIYKSADVFTLPVLKQEAFGNVYVEALACNLPVVAPDDPTRRYIIGKAGFYVDVANKREYALVLKKALNKNFGNVPYEQAKKFSWDLSARKYDQLFKTLRK